MSLTQHDLQEIRTIVQEVVRVEVELVVKPMIVPLANEIKAMHNDIKEIYEMIAGLQKSTLTDESFKKRTLEEKILTLHAELLVAAKQAGITLPRN
jgi:hypothetical protein